MLNPLMNWRNILWITFHVFLIVGSFLPDWRVATGWLVERTTGHGVCSLVRDAPSCFLPSVVGTCPVCIQLGQSFDGPECESVAAGIPATGP
jgi:hypothetical protein